MTKVTKRQKEALQAIVDLTEKHRYPPTVRELCKELNLASPSTVHYMLERLKFHGLITWEPNNPRTLKVLKDDVNKKSGIEFEYTFIDGKLIKVPILTFLHVTVMDRIERHGHIQKLPKDTSTEEIKMVIESIS